MRRKRHHGASVARFAGIFYNRYARKHWISHLDRLLPGGLVRPFRLRYPPVFHYLPLLKEPEARVAANGAVRSSAESDRAAADFQ